MDKIIILDRDGVINYDSNQYIKTPEEWVPIPGSLEAIARLNQAGFAVVLVTNQSGIARGLYDIDMLDRIHQKLHAEVKNAGGCIEAIYFCPHHPHDYCGCRKPKLGLFKEIQKKYNIDFKTTFFIGDSATDMQAAKAVGCNPILVLTGNGEKTKLQFGDVPCFPDLSHAVDFILGKYD